MIRSPEMVPRLYFDHAATTPVRDEVIAAMLPFLGERGFNPSSLHAEGRAARAGLDEARTTVARLLGAKPREIVFTGGGSESDNLAIVGAVRAARARLGIGGHAITAATEHHAVLHAMDVLREEGVAVTVLPVDGHGRIEPAAVAAALRDDTLLVSLMLANNELGTLHPIAEVARLARARGILVHTDAVQAPGRVPLEVDALGVDLLALSAHKCYGPKGVGALYVRTGTTLAPLVVGGGQEAGLRAGTENVAGIVGFARALELAVAELPEEAARLGALRDRLEASVLAEIPRTRINAAGAPRLPNVSSIAFDGVDATELLVRLDLEGVAVSAGSACAAGSTEPSHVIAAIAPPAWARTTTVRFSLGRLSREQDVARLAKMLPRVVAALRDARPILGMSADGADPTLAEVLRS
jgi:cysteine desulfurase